MPRQATGDHLIVAVAVDKYTAFPGSYENEQQYVRRSFIENHAFRDHALLPGYLYVETYPESPERPEFEPEDLHSEILHKVVPDKPLKRAKPWTRTEERVYTKTAYGPYVQSLGEQERGYTLYEGRVVWVPVRHRGGNNG
jgi:hypothetical protein